MLKYHLKVAWRNLLQNKGLSAINILGLGIGMAFAIIIGLWIRFEMSFDTFHQNIDRLAVVRKHTMFNGEKGTQTGLPMPVYYELKEQYPAVKRITRLDWINAHSLMSGENKVSKRGTSVDPDFLRMFTFPVISGNAETALNDPNSIVLTRSAARALFGNENVVGQTLRLDNQHDLQVTAVMEDLPKNSNFDFEFLTPYSFKEKDPFIQRTKTQWGNNFLSMMVEVREGASMEALSTLIGPMIMRKDSTIRNQHLFLQPLADMHLYEAFKDWKNVGGKIKYIRLFGIIGVFVLLIACINFMNLATARSEKRAREVGIRKAVGCRRRELVAQFLCESLLTASIAFVLSLLLVQLLLPALEDFGLTNIRFDVRDASMVGGVLAVCLLTGLIAGSYPAFYLSSFIPLKALKGRIRQGAGATLFRKGLVVSQFVISISLIVCTIIVFQQIQHGRERSVGYDPDNLIRIDLSADLFNRYETVKQDLLNTGAVASVGRASSPLTSSYNSWNGFTWEGAPPDAHEGIVFDVVITDFGFENTARLKFKQGRPFDPAYKTDSTSIILNEAAAKIVGFKDPIGKKIRLDDDVLTIIGVTENVLNRDPFRAYLPSVMFINPGRATVMLIRLKDGLDPAKGLAAIQPVIERHNPAYPFDYEFVDQEFAKKFETENQAGKLAAVFAGLAIFISCLGLFGLAAFMAERRTKEIGIRKVLGASMSQVWILLSKEFVLLVLIACSIATPLALWFMSDWLAQYEYRIGISWWVFLVAGALCLLIALATVSFQAVKAALVNPVKSLKAE
ncbi:ABC transporter permease [Chitinophaga lutea]